MLRKLQEAICEALEVCKKDKKYSHFFFFFVRRIEPKKVDLCTNSIDFIYIAKYWHNVSLPYLYPPHSLS